MRILRHTEYGAQGADGSLRVRKCPERLVTELSIFDDLCGRHLSVELDAEEAASFQAKLAQLRALAADKVPALSLRGDVPDEGVLTVRHDTMGEPFRTGALVAITSPQGSIDVFLERDTIERVVAFMGR